MKSHGGIMRCWTRKQEKTCFLGVTPWAGQPGIGLYPEGHPGAERIREFQKCREDKEGRRTLRGEGRQTRAPGVEESEEEAF